MDSKIREEIARVIESHDAFECRSGWTYPEAAGAIADALLPLLQRSHQAGQEAMRERAREAHRFGFWAWSGPANDAEQAEIEKAERESWEEFRANTASLPLSDKE